MSVTEETLKANETFAKQFTLGHLPMPPARKLAIVACMDARLTVEPADELQVIEGLKHMATAIMPGIYDEKLADVKVAVEAEVAYHVTRQLAREEGLFVGFSAGAAMYAAAQVAKSLTEGVVVVILPDAGDKYLSTGLWK